MADTFGFALGIDGEKQFKQALGEISQNFKVLSSELKLIGSEFNKNDDSIKKATSVNEVYNKKIDEQKKAISVLEQAMQNSASTFGENAKQTKEWEIKLNNANAQLNNMQKELKQINLDSMHEGIKKAKGGFDNLAKAFMGVVGAGAAIGGAFLGMSINTAKVADDLNTLSAKTGLSTEQLQELQYASNFVDVELETMTDSMAKIVKSMTSATDETKGTGAAFTQLGVDTRNADGSFRDSRTVWQESIDALGKIGNETERDAISMQLFGKSAQDLNPLIKAGSEEMVRLAAEAHSLGAVLSEDALAGAQKFDDSVQKLKATGSALFTNLGVELIPVFQSFAEKLSEIDTQPIIDGLGWVIDNWEFVAAGLAAIGAGFAIFQIVTIVQGLIQAFQSFKLATEGMTVAQAALNLVMNANPLVLIAMLIAGLVAALITLYKTNDTFKEKVDTAWKTLWNTGSNIWNGFLDFFRVKIPKSMDNLKTLFAELPGKFLEIGGDIVVKLYEGVKNGWTWLTDKINGLISGLVKAIFGTGNAKAESGNGITGRDPGTSIAESAKNAKSVASNPLGSNNVTNNNSTKANTTINNYTFNSPKSLSPKEMTNELELAKQREEWSLA